MSFKNEFTNKELAKLKVEKLKRFYSHLAVYLVINVIIIGLRISDDLDSWDAFVSELLSFGTLITPAVWGVLLMVHAFSVFLFPKLLGYEWEARKIEQLMEEELKSKKEY